MPDNFSESETTVIRKQTKLGRIYESYAAIPPMFLDGLIAVGIAFLTALSLGFAGEESYKYINPALRFWLVLFLGATVQGAHALSKFRDGTFSRYHDAKEKKAIAADTEAKLQAHPEGVATRQTVTEEVLPSAAVPSITKP